MVKKEVVKYKCLSKKDKQDLQKWFKKPVKKSKTNKMTMKQRADLLKGKNYQVFLNSKYWAIVRKRVLDRDGFKCRVCNKHAYDLHAHHETYKNHFNEHNNLQDLITLCKDCHKDCHKEHHYCTE